MITKLNKNYILRILQVYFISDYGWEPEACCPTQCLETSNATLNRFSELFDSNFSLTVIQCSTGAE